MVMEMGESMCRGAMMLLLVARLERIEKSGPGLYIPAKIRDSPSGLLGGWISEISLTRVDAGGYGSRSCAVLIFSRTEVRA